MRYKEAATIPQVRQRDNFFPGEPMNFLTTSDT